MADGKWLIADGRYLIAYCVKNYAIIKEYHSRVDGNLFFIPVGILVVNFA
jgi:hypothetical protein